jgi:DNA/RNA non-specific endonuclease
MTMNPGEVEVMLTDMLVFDGSPRNRVKELWGRPIARKNKVARGSAAVPSTLLHYDGQYDLRLPHTDAGHLMSLGLGGPNVSINVVPMYSGFNRFGAWKQVEADLLKVVVQGDTLLKIGIKYEGLDKRIPSSFDVRAELNGGVAYSKNGLVHSCPVVDRYTNNQTDSELIKRYFDEMLSANWKMEVWAASVSSGSAPNLPEQGVNRPYAVLDYMVAMGALAADTISNGRKFSGNQRNNILTVNRVLYGLGWIRSDAPDDDHYYLSSDGGDFGAEIDHIVPMKGQAGSNAYSNAQVVSWRKNKFKGMTTS